jgi:hypothetical protein
MIPLYMMLSQPLIEIFDTWECLVTTTCPHPWVLLVIGIIHPCPICMKGERDLFLEIILPFEICPTT